MIAQPDLILSLAWTQFWQVTFVALLVGVFVWLFCRQSPHLAFLLWLLVIIKCLVPPIWSSPTGFFSWSNVHFTETSLPIVTPINLEPPPQNATISSEPSDDLTSTNATNPEHIPTTNATTNSANASRQTLSPVFVFGIIWFCGMLVYFFMVVRLWTSFTLSIKKSMETPAPALENMVKEMAKKFGIKRTIRLVMTNKPIGPVAYGFFRPTLLIPKMIWTNHSPSQIKAILAHELTHIRRGDTIIGFLQIMAQMIWWFHPLIWWANRQLNREKERCCDEEAIARLGCQPEHYAQSLLDVLKLKQKLPPVFALPGVRPGEITSRRMEAIMKTERMFHKQTPRWYWIVGFVAAMIILPGQELVIGETTQLDEKSEGHIHHLYSYDFVAQIMRPVLSSKAKFFVYTETGTYNLMLKELGSNEGSR